MPEKKALDIDAEILAIQKEGKDLNAAHQQLTNQRAQIDRQLAQIQQQFLRLEGKFQAFSAIKGDEKAEGPKLTRKKKDTPANKKK